MATPIEMTDLGGYAGDLSAWGLFMMADPVVKAVMISLILASIWSWAIIFQKRGALKKLHRRANKFEDLFWSGEALDKIYDKAKKSGEDPLLRIFAAGMEEWQAGIVKGLPSREMLQASLKQRVERAMSVSLNREMGKLEKGMTFLATVGSTAPFIGLFGTVWGIMNSFTSIAAQGDSSLLVVAPGMAEALFATALGLVAAIPASAGYNIFSNSLGRYADRLEGFTTEFVDILSRHLDSVESDDDAPMKKKAA